MNVWDRPINKKRIAEGICPDCGIDEASGNGKRCEECKYKQVRYQRHLRSQIRQKTGAVCTPEAYARQAEGKRKLRAARRLARLCIQCAAPSTRFIRCTKCRASNADAKLRFRMRVKAKEINRLRGMAA